MEENRFTLLLIPYSLIFTIIFLSLIHVLIMPTISKDEIIKKYKSMFRLYSFVGTIIGFNLGLIIIIFPPLLMNLNISLIEATLGQNILILACIIIDMPFCILGHKIAVELFVKKATPVIGSVGARQISRHTF